MLLWCWTSRPIPGTCTAVFKVEITPAVNAVVLPSGVGVCSQSLVPSTSASVLDPRVLVTTVVASTMYSATLEGVFAMPLQTVAFWARDATSAKIAQVVAGPALVLASLLVCPMKNPA